MYLPINVGQPIQVLIRAAGRDITCQSEVLDYAYEAFVIRPPKRNGVSIPIEADFVTVSVSTADAVFTMKCEIKSISQREVVLFVPLEEDVQRMQRRQFLRMPTQLFAEAEPELPEQQGQYGESVTGMIQDISGGGCSMLLEAKFESDQVLRISFFLPLDGPISLTGRVLRTINTHASGGGVAFSTSIEFMGLSEAIRSKLIRFVFEIQRRSTQKTTGTGPLRTRGTGTLTEGEE